MTSIMAKGTEVEPGISEGRLTDPPVRGARVRVVSERGADTYQVEILEPFEAQQYGTFRQGQLLFIKRKQFISEEDWQDQPNEAQGIVEPSGGERDNSRKQ